MAEGARFIHTADWQLGLHAHHVPGDAGAEVRGARTETVRRIAEVAREAEADFVVVAGDVFDHHQLDRVPLQRAFEALRGFSCAVYLLPGNHDPFTPDALYRTEWWTRECPPHVHVLGARRPRDHGNATLLPCPLLERHSLDPTAWLNARVGPQDRIRVGVAHGGIREILQAMTQDTEAEIHNDIPIGLADGAGLDYLALGDWHGKVKVNDRTWYPGTPEPTRFKEKDPGHVLLVEVDRPRSLPRVTPHRVARFTWHKIERTLLTAEHLASLEQEIDDLPNGQDTLVELELKGQLDLRLTARLRQEVIPRSKGRVKHLRLRDEALTVRLTDADLASIPQEGWVGRVIARLQAGVEGYSPEACQEALRVLHELHAQTESAGGAR